MDTYRYILKAEVDLEIEVLDTTVESGNTSSVSQPAISLIITIRGLPGSTRPIICYKLNALLMGGLKYLCIYFVVSVQNVMAHPLRR